jgi:hypothetical protein
MGAKALNMRQDDETTHQDALEGSEFLCWRGLRARRKAEDLAWLARAIEPPSMMEIGCGAGAVLRVV